MIGYDLCLAWNWEHDSDFVMLFETVCQSRLASLLQITPANMASLLPAVLNHEVGFQVFWDRASDTDPSFIPIVQWAERHALYRINAHERASQTWNKIGLQRLFSRAGLQTPLTLILPSYSEQPDLPPIDLNVLGESFIIKPAHGGGGEGVVVGATSLSQVLDARKEHPSDKYLLQSQIIPAQMEDHPAWFRVIYCADLVYPFWWNPWTHMYTPVTVHEQGQFGLQPLREITVTIARLCHLDVFSTEICLTKDGRFVVVDYVNDQIDLRLRSKTPDGVPDHIVHDIAERIVALVATKCGLE